MELGQDLSMQDLPREMLVKIFRNLTRNTDRDSAQKVCPLWRSVIENTIGIHMFIGNGSEFWKTSLVMKGNSQWKPLEEISHIGIAECVFSNVSLGPIDVDLPVTTFLLPNLLRKLQFEGFISQNIYQNLCSPLRNLTTLVFHSSTLTHIEVQFSVNTNVLQNLNTIILSSKGFRKSRFPEYNMQRLFDNFCSICSATFPQLKIFDSTFPIFLDKEIQVFESFTSFVERHSTTLTELELRWTETWRLETAISRDRTPEELDAVLAELAQIQLEHLTADEHPSLKWKLKSVALIIEDMRTIYPTSLGMMESMLHQTNLEKAYYMCWNYIPMPVGMIHRNATTLKEIGLTVDDITEPINCHVFTECTQLTRLILLADGQATFDNLATQAPRLQNVQDLPRSLRCLKLRNIYIESQNVEWIAKNLSKLHTLILINIGRVDNLGMTIPSLLWILKHSLRIKTLKVKGLNNNCHLASFGFYKYPQLIASCPVCKTKHYSSDQNIEEESEELDETKKEEHHLNQDNGIVSSEDWDLLQTIFSVTDHSTRFVPLIKYDHGEWSPSNDDRM